ARGRIYWIADARKEVVHLVRPYGNMPAHFDVQSRAGKQAKSPLVIAAKYHWWRGWAYQHGAVGGIESVVDSANQSLYVGVHFLTLGEGYARSSHKAAPRIVHVNAVDLASAISAEVADHA